MRKVFEPPMNIYRFPDPCCPKTHCKYCKCCRHDCCCPQKRPGDIGFCEPIPEPVRFPVGALLAARAGFPVCRRFN